MQHTSFWARAFVRYAEALSEAERGKTVQGCELSICLLHCYVCVYMPSVIREITCILAYRIEISIATLAHVQESTPSFQACS